VNYSTHIFNAPQGGHFLVTAYPDKVTLAYRERVSQSWGPPMELLESNTWEVLGDKNVS
jgi:hypothetical protein